MSRHAFTMKLKPGALAGYKREHDNLWPELFDEIERSGIGTITIFERDPDLFLFSEIRDEDAWEKLLSSDVHQRWTKLMQSFLELGPDGSAQTEPLQEIFHIYTSAGGG